MKRVLWSISIAVLCTGLFLFSAEITYSQWTGFQASSLGGSSLLAGAFPGAVGGYPGPVIPQNYGQQLPGLYNGSPLFPGQNPYSGIPSAVFPGMPSSGYPSGWNGQYPWLNNSLPPLNYGPNLGNQFAGGFYPNMPYTPSPYPSPYSAQWYPGNNPYAYYPAPNFYPYWFLEEPEEDDDDSDESENPSDIAGIWIGTWTSTFVTNGDNSSYAASISLAQEGTTVSGVFLFVENSYIQNLSSTGVVEGDEIEMKATVGEGSSEKTILFDGDAMGDTWAGEYKVLNADDVAIELGEFVVSRI